MMLPFIAYRYWPGAKSRGWRGSEKATKKKEKRNTAPLPVYQPSKTAPPAKGGAFGEGGSKESAGREGT